MKDYFSDDFDDEFDVFTRKDNVLRSLDGIYKIESIDGELFILDSEYDSKYKLAKQEDKDKLMAYMNQYIHIVGDVQKDFLAVTRFVTESSFTRKLNSLPDLNLPITIIKQISFLREYEANCLLDTIHDCVYKRQTHVSKLPYHSCSILTNWLLLKVDKNKKLGKEDIFEDVYLPSGNKMKKACYHFFKENEDYRKEHLKMLANYLLYVNDEKEIQINQPFSVVHNYFTNKYENYKNEVNQILHYLYGLNRNRDDLYKNILLKGQNTKASLGIIQDIANYLNIPYFELNLSSFGDAGDLVGHNPSYSGAMVGRLADKFIKLNTTSAIVVFNRLDDLSTNTTNHASVLANVSELLNNRILSECFLRYDFDIRNTFIVGTCLDEQNLNADIASYFYTIDKNEKDVDEIKDLVKEEINALLSKQYNRIQIGEDVYDLIALMTKIDPFGDAYKKYCAVLVNYLFNMKNLDCLIDVEDANRIFGEFIVTDEYMQEYTKHYLHYDDEVRKKINEYLIDLKRSDEKIQKKAKEKLRYLEHCHTSTPKTIDLLQVKEKLNTTHCGLTKIKDAILNAFCQYNNSPEIASHLMFYSPLCGIGKTSIALDACKAADLDIIRINCAQIASIDTLYGNSTTPGLLLSKIKEIKTTTAPILLDEFEKCSPAIQNSLLNLTDTSNASFYSPYLEVNIPMHCGFMIATVNYLDQVSDALRDRFKLLEFKPYDMKTKKQIIKNKIITTLQKQFTSTLTIDEQEIEDYIFTRPFASIREIESDIRDAYVKAIRNQSEVQFESNSSILHHISPSTTHGLGVVGNQGVLIKFECLFDDSKSQLKGNCKETFQEEFDVVIKHMKHNEYLGHENVFMNIYGSSFPKDGRSAGLAIFASIYAQKNHLDISKFAFTGEVTLMGNVEMIGGLYYKLMAAKLAGIETVIIPYDNASEYKLMQEDLSGLNVYFVKNVLECIELMKGGK